MFTPVTELSSLPAELITTSGLDVRSAPFSLDVGLENGEDRKEKTCVDYGLKKVRTEYIYVYRMVMAV